MALKKAIGEQVLTPFELYTCLLEVTIHLPVHLHLPVYVPVGSDKLTERSVSDQLLFHMSSNDLYHVF